MQEETKPIKEKKKKTRTITVQANKKGRHIMPLLNALRVICVPFIWLAAPFRFYGPRKVKDGAALYVCNHYRLYDVTYPACTTWEGIHFVAKKSISENAFMRFFTRRVKTIDASRDGNDARVLLDGLKCLKNGEKVCVYPEGTRNKTSAEFLPFKSGAAVLAIKAKVPVIPVCIYKKQQPFRMNHVLIGEPFELSEFYDSKLDEEKIRQADDRLLFALKKLRDDHAEFLAAKKRKKKDR